MSKVLGKFSLTVKADDIDLLIDAIMEGIVQLRNDLGMQKGDYEVNGNPLAGEAAIEIENQIARLGKYLRTLELFSKR